MVSRDDDIRAAEFVLGLLEPSEMQDAARDRASDSAFAEAVDAWEALLTPLAESVPAANPSVELRARIEAAIDARDTQNRATPAIAARIDALQRSLAAWRMAAISAAAVAAAIALMWFGGFDMPFRPDTPAGRYIAMLKSETGETGFVVTFDMADQTCAIAKMAPDLPPQKAYELWAMIKNGNGKPPMSLGLVGSEGFAMTKMPWEIDRQTLEKGVKLAISVEPPGGAPEKTSMGPVVFAGELVRLTP